MNNRICIENSEQKFNYSIEIILAKIKYEYSLDVLTKMCSLHKNNPVTCGSTAFWKFKECIHKKILNAFHWNSHYRASIITYKVTSMILPPRVV